MYRLVLSFDMIYFLLLNQNIGASTFGDPCDSVSNILAHVFKYHNTLTDVWCLGYLRVIKHVGYVFIAEGDYKNGE